LLRGVYEVYGVEHLIFKSFVMFFTNRELQILSSWGLENSLDSDGTVEERDLYNKIRDLEYITKGEKEKIVVHCKKSINCCHGQVAEFLEPCYINKDTASQICDEILCVECHNRGRLELVFHREEPHKGYRYECSYCGRVVGVKYIAKILEGCNPEADVEKKRTKNIKGEGYEKVIKDMYIQQGRFLHIGDFQRWMEKEYPFLDESLLDD
jgi:hypothetical protein